MNSFKIIHTADVHLGKRFPELSEESEKKRQSHIEAAFRQVAFSARGGDVRLLLICGDLFDRLNPTPDHVAFAVGALQETLEKNEHLNIVLCPGEADSAQTGEGIDSPLKTLACLPRVHALGLGEKVDSLSLQIEKRPVLIASCHCDAFFQGRISKSDIPSAANKFGVFMLHCPVSDAEGEPDREKLIENALNPIANRGFDYLALGHHHKFEYLDLINGIACFPGSVERLAMEADRDKKYYVSLNVEDSFGRSNVRPRTIRTRSIEYLTLACEPGGPNLQKQLEDLIIADGKEKILYITLEGQMNVDEFYAFKEGAFMRLLDERFEMVCLNNKLSLVDAEAQLDFRQLRVYSPEEEFKRHVNREINSPNATPEEKRLLKEALALGLAEIEEGL